jgi:aryl-alcohol dehydrogenase-like predicted oxidoreductase
MQYTTLGRTNLRVSIAGLGCGGNSRLGLGTGHSEQQAIALVRTALDEGVNFFDTAEAYGTEAILGRAFSGAAREQIVVSSKTRILDHDGNLLPHSAVLANLEQSLRLLRLDHLDIFHLHAVQVKHYEYALAELVPALLEQKRQGKIGHCWEVVMLAFHMLNQQPRLTVFPRTRAQGIGTLLMFVVRNIFSRPEVLMKTMKELAQGGQVPPALADAADPLGFLVHEGGAASVTDAAYRFARHEPGADVVLFGTGDPAHLRSNIASLLKPPLPSADIEKLHVLFGHLRSIGLVFPDRSSSGIPSASV